MNSIKSVLRCYLTLIILINISTSAIQVGPNFLTNAPSEYLVIFAHNYNDPELHEQFGQELENRGFFNTVTIIDTIAGPPNPRPNNSPAGYTAQDGTWIWRSLNGGEWVWIRYQNTYALIPIK